MPVLNPHESPPPSLEQTRPVVTESAQPFTREPRNAFHPWPKTCGVLRWPLPAPLSEDRRPGDGRAGIAPGPQSPGGDGIVELEHAIAQSRHHDLPVRRPLAPGHVRPQDERPGRDPRLVPPHSDQRPRHRDLRAHAASRQDDGQVHHHSLALRQSRPAQFRHVHERLSQGSTRQTRRPSLARLRPLQAPGPHRPGHTPVDRPHDQDQAPPLFQPGRPWLPGNGPFAVSARRSRNDRNATARRNPGPPA